LIKAIEDIAAKNKVEIIKFASSLSAVSFYEKIGYRKNGSDREETAGKQIGMEKHLSQ
jgi:histone acetyltransferase (RNA polymerase elongator complex component)